MSTVRLLLVWVLAVSVQLALAPLLRWNQGFPDVFFLVWLAVLPGLQGRRLALWTGIWALTVGVLSAQPWPVPFLGYGLMAWLWSRLGRVWTRRPRLLLWGFVVPGTLLLRLTEYAVLVAEGASIPPADAFQAVVLPALFWDVVLFFPVMAAVHLLMPAGLQEMAP